MVVKDRREVVARNVSEQDYYCCFMVLLDEFCPKIIVGTQS